MIEKFLITIILINSNLAYSKNIEKENQCCLNSTKHLSFSSINQDVLNESVIIQNFNHFDELNFNCSGITLKTYVLIFIPNYDILLDNTFSLGTLLYSIQFRENKVIFLYKLKGFNFVYFKNIYKYLTAQTISLDFSRFEFYINNGLVDEKTCKQLIQNMIFLEP